MATKLANLPLEIAHYNNFIDFIPGLDDCCLKTVKKMLELGYAEVSTGFEYAVAAVGGHTVISTDEADFSDGSDGKLSSARTCWQGTVYSAPVTNIKGKKGKLRVQVYERKQNKFYYFAIPHEAYKHVSPKSNIEIPFELDGTPRKVPKRKVKQNWWLHEKATFEEMCKA